VVPSSHLPAPDQHYLYLLLSFFSLLFFHHHITSQYHHPSSTTNHPSIVKLAIILHQDIVKQALYRQRYHTSLHTIVSRWFTEQLADPLPPDPCRPNPTATAAAVRDVSSSEEDVLEDRSLNLRFLAVRLKSNAKATTWPHLVTLTMTTASQVQTSLPHPVLRQTSLHPGPSGQLSNPRLQIVLPTALCETFLLHPALKTTSLHLGVSSHRLDPRPHVVLLTIDRSAPYQFLEATPTMRTDTLCQVSDSHLATNEVITRLHPTALHRSARHQIPTILNVRVIQTRDNERHSRPNPLYMRGKKKTGR